MTNSLTRLRNLLKMSAVRQALVLTSIFILILVLYGVVAQFILRHNIDQEISLELREHAAILSDDLIYHHDDYQTVMEQDFNRFSIVISAYRDDSGEQIGDFKSSIFDQLGMHDVYEADLFNEPPESYLTDWFMTGEGEPDNPDSSASAENTAEITSNYPWRIYVAPVPGGRLAVATPLDDVSILDNVLPSSLIIAGLLMTLVTLLGGLFFGLRAQRRMTHISTKLEQIANGNLSVRLATSPPKDDLDQLMSRIDHTTERLDTLMGEIKHLSVNIAHELRTPLARLHAHLEQGLLSEQPNPVAYEKALCETEQIQTIFETILRISKINSGNRKQSFTALPLGTLADDIMETFAPVVEEQGRAIQLYCEEPATIQGDPDAIIQAVGNLIQNAIIHTPPGSEIQLRVDRQTIAVADQGPGIPDEERINVTRPLYRLDKSQGTPGTGLGLALVNAIANLHQAQLTLKHTNPTSPRGLTVTLSFPI